MVKYINPGFLYWGAGYRDLMRTSIRRSERTKGKRSQSQTPFFRPFSEEKD
jgi:hypothetical protein